MLGSKYRSRTAVRRPVGLWWEDQGNKSTHQIRPQIVNTADTNAQMDSEEFDTSSMTDGMEWNGMRRKHDELVLEASRAIFVVLSNLRSPLARTPRLAWTSTDSAPRSAQRQHFQRLPTCTGKAQGPAIRYCYSQTKSQPQFVGTINGL
jgi:hypothetical protein